MKEITDKLRQLRPLGRSGRLPKQEFLLDLIKETETNYPDWILETNYPRSNYGRFARKELFLIWLTRSARDRN